ncbi:MAG: hypothetical protein ACON5B_11470 [Myxococcota bacterium]
MRWWATLWMAMACTSGAGPGASTSEPVPDETAVTETDVPEAGPTWYADVGPLVRERCAGCHVQGGPSFSLIEADEAAIWSSAMALAVRARTMPPWGAWDSDRCTHPHPLQGSLRLTESEIAMIEAWDEAGAPLGAVEDLAAPPTAPSLASPTLEATPAEAFPVQPVGDEIVCARLPVDLTETQYVTGLEMDPGDTRVAHHAVLSLAPASANVPIPEEGWVSCPGGVPGTIPTFFWAPGTAPFEAPFDSALKVEAGAQWVIQMHYHPAGQVVEPTRPTLKVAMSTEVPAYLSVLDLVGNAKTAASGLQPEATDPASGPQFLVPADTLHTETMHVAVADTIGEGARLWGIGNHMHRVGSAMKVNRLVGDACLLDTPVWDFDWHRLYLYDATLEDLPTLVAGEVLKLSCTYDNRLSHPGTVQTLSEAGVEAPVDVEMGGGELDEMCITLLGMIWPNPDYQGDSGQ